MQCLVLDRLALRMDWQTGRGFASARQLAGDASVSEHTVKRATKWGRAHELLVLTRRGHYVNAERGAVASEWRLALASESASSGTLAQSQSANGSRPKVPMAASQGASGAPPSRPRSSRPRTSANGAHAPAHGVPVAQLPECADCGTYVRSARPGGRCTRCYDAYLRTAPVDQILSQARGTA
jgi:DNA-binding transcriptional regulator YhcF (GntR family)